MPLAPSVRTMILLAISASAALAGQPDNWLIITNTSEAEVTLLPASLSTLKVSKDGKGGEVVTLATFGRNTQPNYKLASHTSIGITGTGSLTSTFTLTVKGQTATFGLSSDLHGVPKLAVTYQPTVPSAELPGIYVDLRGFRSPKLEGAAADAKVQPAIIIGTVEAAPGGGEAEPPKPDPEPTQPDPDPQPAPGSDS